MTEEGIIYKELEWLNQFINYILPDKAKDESEESDGVENSETISPPAVPPQPVPLADYAALRGKGVYVVDLLFELTFSERLVLALTLAQYVAPEIYQKLIVEKNMKQSLVIGGVNFHHSYQGFIPTIETAIYLLSHCDEGGHVKFSIKLKMLKLFDANSTLINKNIIQLESGEGTLPYTASALKVNPFVLNKILWNESYIPALSSSFPAEKISTHQDWDDMVVNRKTEKQLEEILSWVNQRNAMRSVPAVARKVLPGYRALFYGPSGTGKTLASTLIGKLTGMEVYRVDLSKLVSKYIGETEKNLKQVFDIAEQHEWILFFDEGDAIFGKRSETSSSNDRYANQEVSYLLQRVERFPGTVIVATNFKTNLDKAFLRRFQTLVHFPSPSEETRKMLWERVFNDEIPKDGEFDFKFFAKNFELTGANIVNVLQQAMVLGFEENEGLIGKPQLTRALTRELNKLDKLDTKTERKLIYEYEECC
ncbi:ATP-binding protein [Aureibacter tunicatorum]|uniref:AAA+ superfamily predicted ATPase n=1 Tax=Aureibacter tunicatorum TaxID=866807 RepID=A0AAE3XGZ0_9BACT|nr:ATP-binding protein [Aureibacter tunicatorum]MDR6237456.1 AAA+ superfamily predicted ATPase [Aureibacter tunicatorum]BDD06445.1 hypothetical protein AUTU_39280 [Aureibacter tunicatorum]